MIGPVPSRDNLPVANSTASWVPSWLNWFQQIRQICFAQSESGTTAQRPTTSLYIGRRYMDLTLNQPVFYTAAGWRDATGTLV